jgi:hypothetical protein
MTTTLTPPPRQRKATGFYFTQGDADVLELLSQYHYLQPRHFQQFSHRHIVSLRRRLRQLYKTGFVDRLTLPLERDWPVAIPPDQFVYRLSKKGLAKAQALGFTDGDSRFDSEKRVTFLAHDLQLTDLHACLELAGKSKHLEVIGWEQRRSVLLDSVGQINPDAFFGLKDLTAPEGQNCRYYFVEIERSGQAKYEAGESSLIRKCRQFQSYAEQKRQTTVWGIRDFRLLVVLPTAQRVENLCEKLEEAELGFKRFWITDARSHSLDEPTKVFGKIFRTPRDFRAGTLYSLIE